ncbi:MAG: hypothetical protein ABIK31_04545 [candidate division WOR-3 bacterium]
MALIKSIAHNPNDTERKNQLMKLIYPELIKNKLFCNPFIPYPEQEDFRGEVILGKLPNNSLCKVPVDSFITHVLFSGTTGNGKINSAYSMAVQLAKLNKQFISLGLKRDIRHLSKYLPLLVLKCSEDSNFQWNILNAPQGVSQIDWDTTFMRVFAATQYLREGAESLLLESLELLRKQHNQVNIFDLFNFIKTMKIMTFRGTNWKESCLNRLQALIINFRKMLNTQNSLPLEKFSEYYNIEFELDKAGEFKSFFASIIPIYLYKYRIANNLRGNYLKNVIFCDEANFLASKSIIKNSSFGDTTLLQAIRVGREFGLGFIFFTNEPYALADSIKAQYSIKVLFRQTHWPDVEDMGKSMNLTKEQMECTSNLPPGQAIVKIPGIQPFPVAFPLINIVKDM